MTGSVVSALVHTVTSRTSSTHAPHDTKEHERDLTEERNAEGWSGGTKYPPGPDGLLYRCNECGAELRHPNSARKHERVMKHTVLRVDWNDPDYLVWILAQPGRNG